MLKNLKDALLTIITYFKMKPVITRHVSLGNKRSSDAVGAIVSR